MEIPGKSPLEVLIESTQEYGKTAFELSKLKGISATSNVLTVLVARLCLFIAAMFFLVIISVGTALWLSEILGKPYYGFFILSGFYLIIVLVFYFFLHGWIKKPFSDLIISKALE